MLVERLRELADLGVVPLWVPDGELSRSVSGVTTADMANPASYLSAGEIVLTGLVWWEPERPESAWAFVAAAHAAGTVALIAGEGVPGRVPEELVSACRRHGLPLFSAPRGTTFRAIIDRIYRWLWAEKSALPSAVRDELVAAIGSSASLDEVLGLAAQRIGLPELALVSASGRVIAGSGTGSLSARVGAPSSPFDGWWLRTSRTVPVLEELAQLLDVRARRDRARREERARAAVELLATPQVTAVPGLVRACGLPAEVALTPVVVRMAGEWAANAAQELLAGCGAPFVVCAAGVGQAVGLVALTAEVLAERVVQRLPLVQALVDGPVITVGIGVSAAAPQVSGARFAAEAAGRSATRVCAAGELTSLEALLAGVPEPVAASFLDRTIGAVIVYDQQRDARLLATLRTFLDSGGSWTRTAAALHLHVNTVHYRIERVEALTGRRVLDPRDQLDLHTALALYAATSGR